MIRSTIVSRLSNPLVLVESVDREDPSSTRTQARSIIASLTLASESKCTIESADCSFHYLVDQGICYLCAADKSFPRALAFSYLDQISRDFYAKHGNLVEAAQRPYAFINFETAMQKTRNAFRDSKGRQNLMQLNDKLQDVAQIMTRNVKDVMERGEKIDRLSTMSSYLTSSSRRYEQTARSLNLGGLKKRYRLVLAMVAALLLVLYLWY